MARPTSIVVAHASIGSGHRIAAEAVARELETLGVSGAAVTVLDALDGGQSPLAGLGRRDSVWSPDPAGGAVRAVSVPLIAWAYRSFAEKLASLRPTVVVCTHPLAATLAARAVKRRQLTTAVVAVATDFGTQRSWPHRGVDLYCVADSVAADELLSAGQRESSVCVTGIPVRAQFTLEYDQAAARDHFGLPADKRLVLALAGSTTLRAVEHFKEALTVSLPALASVPGCAVAVVTGPDEALAEELKSRSMGFGVTNVHVLGFVEHMAPLMAAADVALSVPGGLVCAECLAMGVPLVLVGPASGHERVNAERLADTGAALFAPDPRTVAEHTRKAISKPARLARMGAAATALGRPFAATDVAERVLDLAGVERESSE